MITTVARTFTIREVADLINLSASRVRRLCLTHRLGKLRGGHRFLTDRDIATLRAKRRPAGRPKKS